MELPAITLPQINLPFDISTLLHPAVVHFVMVIPVVILLMELYNLFTKRRSIGAFSFFLLLITVVMLAVSYLTGTTDGKEAYDLLSVEGQAELKEHKLLGIYVLFVSIAVLIFKLLAMTGKGLFRFIFFLSLIGLIVMTFKQGKDGGELVYEHGANVERVKTLSDNLSDSKEELEELNEEIAEKVSALEKVKAKSAVETKVEATSTVVKQPVPAKKPILDVTPVTVEKVEKTVKTVTTQSTVSDKVGQTLKPTTEVNLPKTNIEEVKTEVVEQVKEVEKMEEAVSNVKTAVTKQVAPVEATLNEIPSVTEKQLQNSVEKVIEVQ